MIEFILGILFVIAVMLTFFVKKSRGKWGGKINKKGGKVIEKDLIIEIPVGKKTKRKVAKNENYYNKLIAEEMGIKAGVKLDNGLIVDMLSDTHAYEIDFGGMKTYEGIGQCLVYAYFTDLKPALVILIRDEKEETLFNRIKPAIPHLGIELTVYRVTDRITGEFVGMES